MVKEKNQTELERQSNEISHLEKIKADQDYLLKNLENDKMTLIARNEELINQLNQLTSHLGSKESSLSYNRNKLDDAEKTLFKCQV